MTSPNMNPNTFDDGLDYGKAEGTTYTTRGRFFTAGRHICKVLLAKAQKSRKDGTLQQVVELEVVHSTPIPLGILKPEEVAAGLRESSLSEELPTGDRRTWLITQDNKDMFLPQIKQFMDAVKGSVRATVAAGLATKEEVAEMVEHEGKTYGFDLDKPGAMAAEMAAVNNAPQLAVGLPVAVECYRVKTKKGLLIDATQFVPLNKGEIEKHAVALGLAE